MTWNYRIVHKKTDEYEEWAIHEVYYTADGEPYAVTVNPIAPLGETFDEFVDDMSHYFVALNKPVLEYDDIPFAQGDAEEFLDESKRICLDDIDWESF